MHVILIEGQDFFRTALKQDLSDAKDIEIVGEGTTGEDAVRLISDLAPDIAVIPMLMDDLNGLEVLTILSQNHPHETVIILTTESAEVTIYDAIVAGARGYILKWELRDFAAVLREAMAGHIVLYGEALVKFVHAVKNIHRQEVKPLLTAREQEVLKLISDGLSHSRIAARLQLSPTTIRTHVRNIYAKLGVSGAAAAISEAIKRGEMQPTPEAPRTSRSSQIAPGQSSGSL